MMTKWAYRVGNNGDIDAAAALCGGVGRDSSLWGVTRADTEM